MALSAEKGMIQEKLADYNMSFKFFGDIKARGQKSQCTFSVIGLRDQKYCKYRTKTTFAYILISSAW